MPTYTTYKDLEKPLSTDKYSIAVNNRNNNIIDSELHKLDLENENQDKSLATTKEALNSEVKRAIMSEETIHNSLSSHVSDKSNPHKVTPSQLNLGNVNNTSDINKPVSTAQQNAIDAAFMQSNYYTDVKIAELIDGAPTTLDTLKEIADAMAENENVVNALETAIGTKANETEYQTHATNNALHITSSERQKWNGAVIDVVNLENELEEVRQSFQNGCSMISGKLTSLGIATAENASPEVIAANIQRLYDVAGANVSTAGTASSAEVLTGYTFSNANEVGINGAMPNRGAMSQVLNCGDSYTILEGYHNGSGKITTNSLASQTQATAIATNITSGKTAYVNGIKITGTGADNTTNYNNGYNAGVVAADARVNTASANYKGGYNAGYAAGSGSRGRVYKAFLNYTGNWNTTWTINVGFTACMVVMCGYYVAGSSYQTYAVYTPTENFIAINNQNNDKGTKVPWIPTFSGNNIILPIPDKSIRATTPVFILAMDQTAFNL